MPSRYQRYAVVTWMPCACTHSVRFTLQHYYLEHAFAIRNTPDMSPAKTKIDA